MGHLVLHAAAHLFQDGELDDPLRELVDIAELARLGAGREGFWEALFHEASELDLERPLFYALRYSRKYLEFNLTSENRAATNRGCPPAPLLALMDGLVSSVVERQSSLATEAFYGRANWLKMPPSLLIRHLAEKTRRLGQARGLSDFCFRRR